jgi:YrbI family 3-deoxy-D-manno-octulosonate 8-phosphate phosphatase
MIKLIIFDFDGVFTDGMTTIDSNGTVIKRYNAKDGMGISLLKKNNIEVGVISGYKENESQLHILKHLKIKYVALGIKNKIDILKKWCLELNVDLKKEVAYMGDDLNDLQIIDVVECSGCPADAVPEVKEKVKFISKKNGGYGCIREFSEYIMKKLENRLGYFDKKKNKIISSVERNDECIQEVDQQYKDKIKEINNLNVIILSSDPTFRSLTKCHKNKTLLEYQIRTLLITGIKKYNIYVVCNNKNNDFKFLEHIGCNIYNHDNNFRSGDVLNDVIKNIKINKNNYLIIQGHLFFSIHNLEIIFNCLNNNVIFSDYSRSTIEKNIHINNLNDTVESVTDNLNNIPFPWNLFNGFILLNNYLMKIIYKNEINLSNKNIVEYIFSICKSKNIKLKNFILNENNIEEGTNSNILELKGGSYASLNKISTVRKMAKGKGYSKLEYELKFLENNITKDILEYFPKIINKYKDDTIIYFDMPFYNFECLQRVILTGKINKKEIIIILKKVYNFIFNKLFVKIINNNTKNWIEKKHINRVLTRLDETSNYSEDFKKIIDVEYIQINNKMYKNIKILMNKIKNNNKFLSKMEPDYMRLIHGDLHFENIMIYKIKNEWKFKLIDPRGELTGSDLYYDMGKLYHSFNGLYDFIRTDQFEYNYNFEENNLNVNLIIGDKMMLELYNNIKLESIKIFKTYQLIKSDQLWEVKSRFAEVMHWCSVFPFHMHNKRRSEALYFRAVILLNNFIKDYEYLL